VRSKSIENGHWCRFCINKTEKILYEKIIEYFPSIVAQFIPDWIKPKRFDFCILEYKIIIELDGEQHFRQVWNWKSPEEQQECDKFKQEIANNNSYSVIRLLQYDVFNDKYDWKTELIKNIEKIKTDNIIQNIYMCKNNEYECFI
jgi:very-short-patch-repair endonuclease